MNDSLTLSLINKASNSELYKYAKEYKIPRTEIKDMAHLKQLLILKVLEGMNTITDSSWYTDKFQKRKMETIEEDCRRRNALSKCQQKLHELYQQINKLECMKEMWNSEMVEKDDPLKSRVKNDIPGIEEQFDKVAKFVSEKPRCSLLVCGDSGAGKSSFINLLVGKNILPTSIQSNTSCQVKMTFDTHERAEIIDNNQKTLSVEKEEFSDSLRGYLENKEDREKKTCESATIFLNSSILEGGLDIYDTIGLGENEKFNEELKKDLQEITGVIFLLKRNNPIGDQTVGGLSQIITHMITKGLPGGSMNFIINMCDLLKVEEEAELKKNVADQLREKCTLLSPDITTFSTKQELFLQQHKIMSKNYREIMNQIENLHIASINTNAVRVFNFLFEFTKCTINNITELEKYSSYAAKERKDYIMKMKNLKNDRKLLIESFRKENDNRLKWLYRRTEKDIRTHFQALTTKECIISDVVRQQNQLINIGMIDVINKAINNLTQEAILKNFEKYVDSQKILINICEELFQNFLKQFAEFMKKKNEIQQQMNVYINAFASFIKGDIDDLLRLPPEQRSMLKALTPILVPILRTKDIIVEGIDSFLVRLLGRVNESNLRQFYENTNNYVKLRAVKYYDSFFSKSNNIKSIMKLLFEAPNKVTSDFERYLNDDIDLLGRNIGFLEEDLRTRGIVFQTYEKIKLEMLQIYEDLCRFNLLFLQEDKYHISMDEIKILNTSDSYDSSNNDIVPLVSNRSRQIFRGRFRCENDQDTDSSIIKLLKTSEKTWGTLYQECRFHEEIMALKYDRNKCIIETCFNPLLYHAVYSVDDSSDLQPTFVTKGIDMSLKTYIDVKSKDLDLSVNDNQEKAFEDLCQLLKQILTGLEYLHENELVHFDLTIESIGYCSTYQSIKLTSISTPVEVKIESSISDWKDVLKIAHFPIEIFTNPKKEKYTPKTDIYCLASVIYHMWFGVHPFYDKVTRRINSVSDFVNMLNTTKFDKIVYNREVDNGFQDQLIIWSLICFERRHTAKSFLKDLNNKIYYGRLN